MLKSVSTDGNFKVGDLIRIPESLRLLAEKFKNKQTIIIKQRDNGEIEAFIKGD
jgi:hypothetical protein